MLAGRLNRTGNQPRTLALGSLPPPSLGSRHIHFFLFPLSGTQVARLVIPIFPVFSVCGLEQLAVGLPLAVASPIVVVSLIAIRVSVEGLVSSLFWNKVQCWLQLSNGNWELVKIIASFRIESVVSLPNGKIKAGPILVAINPFKKVPLYDLLYSHFFQTSASCQQPLHSSPLFSQTNPKTHSILIPSYSAFKLKPLKTLTTTRPDTMCIPKSYVGDVSSAISAFSVMNTTATLSSQKSQVTPPK
ncbi:hypothetical protein Ahy_B07g088438 [Arachis hypogaea]|uniref:Myosin-1-3 N-terminal SH3 domain-containing protein n=1 Tax=Arachis hypogaea TaxID=3818 RepID=A0A444YEG7_ARAHY|nr:hypothetical protein Ahy_B07g088438 [Arachis hypogaea]